MTGPASRRLTVIDYESIPDITPEQGEAASRRIAERARDADDARLLLGVVLGWTTRARTKPVPPRREPKPCGTSAAYKRHTANREEPCQPCKDAMAAERAGERARRRLRNPPPPGSPVRKRKGKHGAVCSPGVRYEPAGFRVGRCDDCGQLAATHVVRGGVVQMMSHPLAGQEAVS